MLAVGREVHGSVSLGQMVHYSYLAPEDQLELTITVTPTVGNPNLYINTGAAPESTELPVLTLLADGSSSCASCERKAVSPGDDALSFTLAPYRRALQIGVFGETASEYTLVLSTTDTIIPLTAGESKRFSSRVGGYRYFSATVPRGQAIDITVTPLTGDPDLFVSASAERPDSTSPECAAMPSWCSSVPGSRYEHVQISANDGDLACPPGGATCTYHIGVHAKTAATYTVVVLDHRRGVIRLVDGLPQAALIEAAGVSRYYKTRVAGTHTDLSILLAASYGSAQVYVQTGSVASAQSYKWSTRSSSPRLLIRHDDERFCADCDYYITVRDIAVPGGGGTAYTLSATSSHGTTVLESGAPCSEVVNMGRYEYFKVYVTVPLVEVQVIMTTLSGNPDLYISLTTPYPNASDYHLKSTDAEGDLITLTTVDMTLGSGSVLRSKDAQLEACVAPGATSATAFDTSCVLYVAVYGALGASTFTLSATVRELSAGFHVDAPTAIVADYASSPATFGPRMGSPAAISGAVVYASPGSACPPTGSTEDWRLSNAAAAAGSIVLLDRGPSDDVSCPYPGRYFASKVMQAQKAGALAVIVANDAASAATTSPDALVNMGAVAGDQSALITIPSAFVSLATGELLKRQLSSGVRATFATPSDRLPILVPGLPQVGATDENRMRYYEVFIGPALHDRLTISVAPRFGNPDLFVTTSHSGRLPTHDSSDWSSEADGADSLVIDGGDAKACRNCLYYVGVLGGVDSTGGRASASFTITASVASDARTLQSSVPATGQEVAIEEYLFYRFYVDRPGQGVTVGLTLDSGDADLYVSFAEERPTKLQSQFSAAGRITCQNIDCGNSIEDGDAVHISAQQALEHCPAPPCLAYVGVYGAVATTFNLLVTVSDASQETPVQLLDGAEQSARLLHAGDYAYFYFSVGEYAQSFDVNIVAAQGDPDLYIGTARNGSYPDREHFLLRSTSDAGESLTVRTDAPGGCSGCDYRFAVYAWKASTFFNIAVTAQGGVRKLRDGSPASLRVQAGEVKYLGYRLLTATKLDVIVTPWSGNPSLFVQFGYKPFNPEGRTDAAAQLAPFASTEPAGVEVVTLSPGPSGTSYNVPASSVPCWVYVAIRGDGGANASCSVLVQQRASAPATLVDGQPQAGLVGRSGMRLYSVAVADMSHGLTITLTPDYGAPKLYLSSDAAGRTPPTRSSYRKAADADSPQPYTIHVDPLPATTGGGGGGGGRVYLLGVDGQGHAANFSLVARSGRSIEALRDHVQTLSTITPGETYFYSVDVPAGAPRPTLYVAPLQASARVALLDHVVRVDEWSTRAVQAALTHEVTVTPALPLALPLTPGGRNMVAVSNGAAGGGGVAVEVLLTPLLTPGENELVLGDGKPQFYQAAAGERVLFVYVPGPAHTIPYSISAIELDQPPDAALEMYVGQRRHPEGAARLSDDAAVGLCSYDGYCVAQAEAGEVIQASFRGELEDACGVDDAACRIYITLVPSAAAKLTVTASAAGRLTRMPLGRSHAVSDVVAAGAYKDFELKLQPDDAADDELEARRASPVPHPSARTTLARACRRRRGLDPLAPTRARRRRGDRPPSPQPPAARLGCRCGCRFARATLRSTLGTSPGRGPTCRPPTLPRRRRSCCRYSARTCRARTRTG